ncbi:sensor histidine kinase [Nocardia callitridis]|uniref:histidine kinase n=1 Tax=Nocardia callitridis TaxID=648753 RepID=A0ABP9JV48_9NOCA
MTETPVESTLVLGTVTETPPARPRSAARGIRAVLLAPFQAQTWKEFAYLLAVFMLGGVAISYLFTGVGGGALLVVTIIGAPVLALVLLGGRLWSVIYRALARHLLDTDVPEPPPFAPKPGLIGFLVGAFTDAVSWRALGFLFLQCAIALVGGYLLLVGIAMTVFTALSPIPWVLFHPTNIDADGVEHHSLGQFGNYFIDSWPRVLGLAAIGVIGCFVLPWLLRVFCWVQRVLTVALLGATTREQQVIELREGRRAAVVDSAATLQRLERDLHDGTQARLVTIAMALGRAEDRLAAGNDPGDLIADARASSKEALTELRELVRGIHPPALELGLEPALETLTARCSIPVRLRVDLPQRPSSAIESIAYFSTAELLTNVIKHAAATEAWVSVLATDARTITVTVRDNGIGGVRQPAEGGLAGGSGLLGLAARAKTVDGTLTVHSPLGGPTEVSIRLPKAGPR